VNSLPGDTGPVLFWRLDDARYASSWDSGEGARLKGGRWNPVGLPAVYCALDPGTAILEVAVHKGFHALNALPHVLTSATLRVPWSAVHVVRPADVANGLWLYPCAFSAAQQAFGRALLEAHDFVAIPSAVSRRSWTLCFDPRRVAAKYVQRGQEPLDLDPRLDPPR
jgi:RES domain-containing protein